eukprot:TRINITY_DN5281_c0_g1_i2.p1 TRINITY_DN5281_c0_g1~~TRINITY_DN5281_c0_g1_i2.p1  ORF type:complete len:459 (-),score=109.22 TRINITY_DN5281_c0_g1_i2:45-1421(-)
MEDSSESEVQYWQQIAGVFFLDLGIVLLFSYCVYYYECVIKQRQQHRKAEIVLGTAMPISFFLAHISLEFNSIFLSPDTNLWDSIQHFDDILGLLLVVFTGLAASVLIYRSLWWQRGHPILFHMPDWHGIAYMFEAFAATVHFWYDNYESADGNGEPMLWRSVYRVFGTAFVIATWSIVNYTSTNILRIYVRQKAAGEMTQRSFDVQRLIDGDAGMRSPYLPIAAETESAPRVVVSGRTYSIPTVFGRGGQRSAAISSSRGLSGLQKMSHPVIEDSVPWLLWAYVVVATSNAMMGAWVMIETLFYVLPGYTDDDESWHARIYSLAFALVLVFYYTSSIKLSYVLMNPRLNVLYPYYQDLLRDYTTELDIQQGAISNNPGVQNFNILQQTRGAGSGPTFTDIKVATSAALEKFSLSANPRLREEITQLVLQVLEKRAGSEASSPLHVSRVHSLNADLDP